MAGAALIEHRIRLHGGLDRRVGAVALHEQVGGAIGLGSACEVATEEQEQHDGDQ